MADAVIRELSVLGKGVSHLNEEVAWRIQRHLLKIHRYYISPEARKGPIQSGEAEVNI